jgi:antirestriction protein ArdC
MGLCRYRHKGHWCGAETRLARQFGKRFGDSAYAFEELVAELTAAFLMRGAGDPGTTAASRVYRESGSRAARGQ